MKWFKTSESVPVDNRNVLAAVRWDENLVIAYHNKSGWNISVDIRDYLTVSAGWSGGYIVDELKDYEVTHWAEMPSLPEGHETYLI